MGATRLEVGEQGGITLVGPDDNEFRLLSKDGR
jgi:hypothetical protein